MMDKSMFWLKSFGDDQRVNFCERLLTNFTLYKTQKIPKNYTRALIKKFGLLWLESLEIDDVIFNVGKKKINVPFDMLVDWDEPLYKIHPIDELKVYRSGFLEIKGVLTKPELIIVNFKTGGVTQFTPAQYVHDQLLYTYEKCTRN